MTSSRYTDVYSPNPPPASPATAGPSRVDIHRRGPRGPQWLREPLLHFIAVGAVLFGVDYVISSQEESPNKIVVGAEVNSEAYHAFETVRGRKPNQQELEALHRIWIDNEVLYREGLALGVDRGDPAIRERVIFKALSVVDSAVKLPQPTEQTLRDWFEANRHKYDEPARFDFEEAALSGKASESEVREFVAALNAGTPGDAKAGLRVFKARPRPSLLESYGAEFASALEQAPLGTWLALETRDGWRAIRVKAIIPPRLAVFEGLRGPILQDWKDTMAAEQRTASVRKLAEKYQIEFEEVPEHDD